MPREAETGQEAEGGPNRPRETSEKRSDPQIDRCRPKKAQIGPERYREV